MIPRNYLARRNFLISVVKWMLEKEATLRQAEKEFRVAKSTIHRFCRVELLLVDKELATEIGKLLDSNLAVAPYRGGEALKQKKLKERNAKNGNVSHQ